MIRHKISYFNYSKAEIKQVCFFNRPNGGEYVDFFSHEPDIEDDISWGFIYLGDVLGVPVLWCDQQGGKIR